MRFLQMQGECSAIAVEPNPVTFQTQLRARTRTRESSPVHDRGFNILPLPWLKEKFTG